MTMPVRATTSMRRAAREREMRESFLERAFQLKAKQNLGTQHLHAQLIDRNLEPLDEDHERRLPERRSRGASPPFAVAPLGHRATLDRACKAGLMEIGANPRRKQFE